ncbi:MAG: hypothetical protein QXM68_01620 [Candidatus Aenigmatarchaeota archaeon]|nr:hypothetical protein [Candidatus Aenigmarchaeota archaeon]
MKKVYLIALIMLLPMLVAAQNLGMQELKAAIGKPEIERIGVIGKGIAISDSDSSAFEIVKIGVVDVTVQFNNQTITRQAGILWVGQNKYTLKNSVIGNGTLSSEIYMNDTKIGSLDLVLVEKDGTDVWTGKMTLNSKDYNLYILEGQRKFERNEIKQKFQQFCQGNNTNCTQIAKGIGNRFCDKIDDPSCREKIGEFCEQNPTDQRCIAITKGFCQNNTDDARCRYVFKNMCAQNPNSEDCSNFCQGYPEKCNMTRQNTERIKEKLQQMQETREKMKNAINQRRGKGD